MSSCQVLESLCPGRVLGAFIRYWHTCLSGKRALMWTLLLEAEFLLEAEMFHDLVSTFRLRFTFMFQTTYQVQAVSVFACSLYDHVFHVAQ